ncbi:MAG: DedA family protein [Prevotellaceae bacterium]|nr:DedA family protein [Prevotellaceae bacterium]MDO4931297.1 DedA family protein [Prevotellaceae bacterium]
MLEQLLENFGYDTVFWGMLLESTVIPVPSEIFVPPAAYRAAAGLLNIWMVIIVATIGADCGAIINYGAAYYLGRPIIYSFANSRWGKMCLLNKEKIESAEQYFDKHGAVATLTGRLVPVIRQLISVPAGLAKMNFWRFLLYTTIGAGSWNCILAAIGYHLHSVVPADQLDEKVAEYSEYIKFAILGLLVVFIVYFLTKKYYTRKKE